MKKGRFWARDARHSEAVQEAWKRRCPHCGRPGHPHHVIPRGCRRTRWVVECCVISCDELHRIFEGKFGHDKKMEAIRVYVGEQKYANLEQIKLGRAGPEDFGYKVVG